MADENEQTSMRVAGVLSRKRKTTACVGRVKKTKVTLAAAGVATTTVSHSTEDLPLTADSHVHDSHDVASSNTQQHSDEKIEEVMSLLDTNDTHNNLSVATRNTPVFMTKQEAMDVTLPVPLPMLIYRDYKRKRREFAIVYHIDNPKGWEYFVDKNKMDPVKSFVFIKKFEPEVELLAEPAGTFFRVKGTSKNVWFGWKMAHNGKPPYMQQVCNQGGGFINSRFWTTLIRDTLSKFCKGKQVKHTTHADRTLQSLSHQLDLDPMDLLRYLAQDRPDVENWHFRIQQEIRDRPIDPISSISNAPCSETTSSTIPSTSLVKSMDDQTTCSAIQNDQTANVVETEATETISATAESNDLLP